MEHKDEKPLSPKVRAALIDILNEIDRRENRALLDRIRDELAAPPPPPTPTPPAE